VEKGGMYYLSQIIMKIHLLAYLLIIIFGFGANSSFLAQEVMLDTCKVFKSFQEALDSEEDVYVLDLSKDGLKEFPLDVLKLTELRSLKLSKNKLTHLPDEVAGLDKLEEISLSKNSFSTFPIVLTKLTCLKRIYIDQNEITAIPHDINKLVHLELLDMWSNDVYIVPDSLSELDNLTFFYLSVIQMSTDDQERINKLLPNTKVYFSNTCNCAH